MVDEELSDATDDAGGVDDMDLMVSDEDPYQSGSENEDETPAEKRLRLAQLYLDGVKNSLGTPICTVFGPGTYPSLQGMEATSTLLRSTRS